MTATTGTTTPRDMIHVIEIGPGLDILIGDSGRFVLRFDGQSAEADPDALIDALTRAKPVAALVARSATAISGMSAQVEAALPKFGCARVSVNEGTSDRDALVIAALDRAAEDCEQQALAWDCRACAGSEHGPGKCPEHQEYADRAAEFRAERDRREAGR